MTARRPRLAVLVVGVAGLLAACTQLGTPTSGPTPAMLAASTRPAAGAPVAVRFAGSTNCATFPYSCSAHLSVLGPGVAVADAWRPLASDPWWGPDWSGGWSGSEFQASAVGDLPDLDVGSHQIVISLLGMYDTPSYAPDGTIAKDLLSRCSTDVVVTPTTNKVPVLITFTPDGQTFGGTCTVEVEP